LYVGGDFSSASALPSTTKSIAKWSGTSWSSLGNGINGPVYSLLYDASISTPALFVAGGFNAIVATDSGVGTTQRTCRIMQWTPSTSVWAALDQGLDDDVLTLALDPTVSTNVIAGGRFLTAGHYAGATLANVDAPLIASWPTGGSQWTSYGHRL